MSREYWNQWLNALREEEAHVDMQFLKQLLQRSISSILDIGAGRGIVMRELAQLGFRVTCVDYSLEAISHLQRVSQALTNGHMDVVCADCLFLPFGDENFGAVTSFMVMNFFVDESERRNAFEEVSRVVKMGGVALVVVLSAEDEGRKGGTPLGNGNVKLPDGICLHYYTPSELETLLEDMNVEEMSCFQEEDTSHSAPHTHAFIRVLASRDK